MEERFFTGIKNNIHNLENQLLTVILIWAIICTVLIRCLFSYYENYVQKQEAKVIYEIEPSVDHLEAQRGSRKYIARI